MKKKKPEFIKYTSMEDMIARWEKERAARPLWQKIWDWIYDNVLYKIWDVISPRYNWNRLQYVLFYLKHGWSKKDLWSLDYAFCNWVKKNILSELILNVVVARLHNYKIVETFQKAVDLKLADEYGSIKECQEQDKFIAEAFKDFFDLLWTVPDVKKEVVNWWHLRLPEFEKIIHGYPSMLEVPIPFDKPYDKLTDKEKDVYQEEGMKKWKEIIRTVDKGFMAMLKSDKRTVEDIEGIDLLTKYLGCFWD